VDRKEETSVELTEKELKDVHHLLQRMDVSVTGARPKDLLHGASPATRGAAIHLTPDSAPIPPYAKHALLLLRSPIREQYLLRLQSMSFIRDLVVGITDAAGLNPFPHRLPPPPDLTHGMTANRIVV
jgi:hypothetical protein